MNFIVNGIQVTVVPDTEDRTLEEDTADTKIKFDFGANIDYEWKPRGRQKMITSFTGPDVPSARIQTSYGTQATAESPSHYGRGTTVEDIEGGKVTPRSTTLGFHEGSHGLAYVEFMENNSPPQFTGAVDITETEFKKRTNEYHNNFNEYIRNMIEFSTSVTDCVGTITIDQLNESRAAAGATINLLCPQ